MFDAIASISTRRPWLMIGAWVVIAFALMTIGGQRLYDVTTMDTTSFLPTSYESAKAIKFGEAHFGTVKGTTTVTGLIRRKDRRPLTDADQQTITSLAATFASWRPNWNEIKGARSSEKGARALEPHVLGLAGHGRDELVSLDFKGNAADPVVMKAFKQFRKQMSARFSTAGLQVGFTGGIAEQSDITDATRGRTQLEQFLLFGAVILLTAIFFRGVLSSILPLLLVFLVAQAGTGLVVLSALGFGFHLDSSIPQLITVVLIGIGIDYFLFMVFRFRERLRLGEERKLAAYNTARSVSRVVASAALAIVVAFASLGLAQFGQFRVIGPSVAISVGLMLLAGITLVPALLAATGKKLFWPSRSWQRERTDGRAYRLGSRIAARPGRTLLLTGGALVALTIGTTGIKMSYDAGSGPKNTEAARVKARIDALLPKGVIDQQQIYISSGHALTTAELQPLETSLARVPYVGQVSAPRFANGGRAAELDLSLTIDSTTSKALDLAKAGGPLRTAAHAAAPPGTAVLVGGNASAYADIASSVSKDLKLIFPVAALLILLILFLLLRSAVAPFYLIVAVGLEFAATLGATTLVFQHAQHRPGVLFTMPLILFLFVVAMGTDYNILMSARLREELEAGASVREATARAVRQVAPAIASAGLVLAASFSTLMLEGDLNSREVGFGMAVGILIASFIVSSLLVPAVTTLVGEKAWWPRRREQRSAKALQPAPARIRG